MPERCPVPTRAKRFRRPDGAVGAASASNAGAATNPAAATAVVARNSRRVSGFCDVVFEVFIGVENELFWFKATRGKYQLGQNLQVTREQDGLQIWSAATCRRFPTRR